MKQHEIMMLGKMPLSHPVRVRGLKLVDADLALSLFESHPVRVRGLKQADVGKLFHDGESRTPCGCVD